MAKSKVAGISQDSQNSRFYKSLNRDINAAMRTEKSKSRSRSGKRQQPVVPKVQQHLKKPKTL